MSTSENDPENAANAEDTGTTLLTLVVDRSGSMATIKDDMEGGLRTLIEEQANEPGECLVTLAQFDDHYEVVADGVPAADLPPHRLVPRAAPRCSMRSGAPSPWSTTASRAWTRLQVMDSVTARTAEGWHFTFLGADQDAVQEGRGMGVDAAASLTFDKSADGVTGAMRSASAAYKRLRSGEALSLEYTEEERRAASGD